MPEQFTVPQFIDVEDKILGPLSVRQFLILLCSILTDVALWKILTLVYFLLIGVPLLAIAIVFTFAKVNGMPFHFFVLNLVQTFRKPHLRVWDKNLSLAEVKNYLEASPTLPSPPPPAKNLPSSTRLQELSLLVNTGGAYRPED